MRYTRYRLHQLLRKLSSSDMPQALSLLYFVIQRDCDESSQ